METRHCAQTTRLRYVMAADYLKLDHQSVISSTGEYLIIDVIDFINGYQNVSGLYESKDMHIKKDESKCHQNISDMLSILFFLVIN